MTSMLRLFRRLAIVVALLGAWALVGSDRVPMTLQLSEANAGPSAWRGRGAEPAVSDSEHDLSSLRVLTKVILYVRDNYVDPNRVKPKEMMVAALDYVEKSAPEVLVEGSAETGKVSVNVNGKMRSFDIQHVDSLWKMSFMLKDVFDHIAKNLRPTEQTRDIEYAAINGMLSTLDPHSVLLRPELFREMQLSTKGEFGGLGFVIQMREGNLTVVSVLPKTPAARAGIKKDDHISRIGEESTVNMDLNEAVSKLRGPVDSKVGLTVRREGEEARNLTLARAMITIESVQSKLLAKNVGYLRLKNFQGNTTRDAQAALKSLKEQAAAKGGLKGLVLDMRGNPGGLLDQAIQISDMFLDEGTIVATVGGGAGMRDEKPARKEPFDRELPIAVLVNSGSASASEIVAGALKNLDRAVVIGRQTFGKGSVQVLYDFPDDSALKLTIAKYLTPGDKSIQEVGIMPDIELTPTRVTRDRVDVYAPRKTVGEADLDKHFGNPDSEQVAKKREDVLNREKPLAQVRYLKEDEKSRDVASKDPEDKKKAKARNPLLDVDTTAAQDALDDQMDAESQDEIKEDFEVLFARDYVLQAPFTDRTRMLEKGKAFVQQSQDQQADRIHKAIGALGLNWKEGKRPQTATLDTVLTPSANQPITAGETLELKATVTNNGKVPLHRVRGWTTSENPWLDRREFLFGSLAPGESHTWTVPIRIPKDFSNRRDDVTLQLYDDQGELPGKAVSELSFRELPRPAFAFTMQVQDACASCNRDGLVQKGEQVELLLDVTNIGKGPALATYAQIKNGGDPQLFIEKGRFQVGELAAGETKTARFLLQVKPGFKGESYPLELAIVDEPLEEFLSSKLDMPIADKPVTFSKKAGTVSLSPNAQLYSAPKDGAAPVMKLPKGATLTREGIAEGWVRVQVDGDRFAFAKATDASDKRGKAQPLKSQVWTAAKAPPQITLDTDQKVGPVVADGERFTLSGTVTNPAGLLDVYVLVNDQKVYFQAVDPKGKEPNALRFSTDFALDEGNNVVLVVARESPDFANRRALVVRRSPAALATKVPAAQEGAKAVPPKSPIR